METIQTEPTETATAPAVSIETIVALIERLTAEALALPDTGVTPSTHLDLMPDGTLVVGRDYAVGRVHGEIASFAGLDEPERIHAAIAGALRGSAYTTPSLLTQRARILGGATNVVRLGNVTVRQRPQWRDTTRTLWQIDGQAAAEIVAADPWAVSVLSSEPVDLRAVAQLAWEHLGCPSAAVITVVPMLGRGVETLYDVEDYAISDGEPAIEAPRTFRALTTRDSVAELPADSDPIVQALHLRDTTHRRHESRRRAAMAALCQYVLEERWPTDHQAAAWVRLEVDQVPGESHPLYPTALTDEQRCAVATIAALERHGVGGPGGYSGDSTARMSWATGLGKGRRQASDGEAWTAAISAIAPEHVTPEDVLASLPYVRYVDLEWPMALALHEAYGWRDDRDRAAAWCAVARAVYALATASDAPYTDKGAVALGLRYGAHQAAEDAS